MVAGGGAGARGAGPRATPAAAIYAASLSALLGISALYHRVNWRRPEIRRWMRRLDHTMIFLLIAGTVTPFALLVLARHVGHRAPGRCLGGRAAGTVVELIWVEAPKWVTALVYVAVGWIGALRLPRDRRSTRGSARAS